MAVIVVGGQCSKVGKTAVGCALIRARSEFRWTAVKISPHDYTSEVFFVEQNASDATDTGRYLAAGAKRAVLISGDVRAALPRLREEITAAEMTLIESNRALEFIKPDFLLFVVDPTVDDFKESALRWMDNSDALLIRSTVPDALAPGVQRFLVGPEGWVPAGLLAMLLAKPARSPHSL